MKIWYTIAFTIAALVLCYGIIRTRKSDRKIARSIERLLEFAAVATFANIIAMLSGSEGVFLAMYGIFYVCMDWMMFYMLLFAAEYTGHQTGTKTAKRVLQVILGVDSASMLLNIVFRHAFACQSIQTEANETYYRIEAFMPYQLHLGVAYVIVGMTLLFLAVKTVQAPAIYRGKYILVFVLFSSIVVTKSIYIFTRQVVDISIIFFAAGGIAFYYAAIVYSPKDLLNNTFSLVVDGMAAAVVLFDADVACVRVNENAERLFDMVGERPEDAVQKFAEFAEKRKESGERSVSLDIDSEREGREIHLQIEYERMEDRKRQYLGCFFIIRDQTTEVDRRKEEHYRATHDELTGLYNKQYFYEQTAKCLREHPGEQFLMVCSNIRNFKLVNDIFGPRAGDELLIKIGNALRGNTLAGQVYGRLESDRFALLMRREDYEEQVFVQMPKELIRIDSDMSYPVNIHVGVYDINDPEIPVQVMCDRAFMAINSIQGNYQSRVAYYDHALRESVLREQEMLGEMEPAMASGQFHIYLQPQITAEGEVRGAEALVRWIHPEKGMIVPGIFISAFEKSGMIYKLDQHVWELACRQLKAWKEQGRSDMYLSVNISPRDFYYLDIYKVMLGLVQKYDIDPRNLKLEITETAVMMNLERQLALIEQLRSAGFVIEMDDFGSGYSSLNMLKDIRVDILKVDMAFLGQTNDEERGRKILKRVIEMSKDLGMPVITEGVETEEQVDYLTRIGCDMFQGYYFAKPMPVMEFEKKYMMEGL